MALYPGGSSDAGFLSHDETYEEVVKKDSDYLKSVGIESKQLGELLNCVKDKYIQSFKQLGFCVGFNWYDIDDNYKVKVISWLGYQECPFGCDERTDCDYIIKKDDKTLEFSGLLPHLILKHNFFEGNTPYRVCPKDIIKFFQLDSNPILIDTEWKYTENHINFIKTVLFPRYHEAQMNKMNAGLACIRYSS